MEELHKILAIDNLCERDVLATVIHVEGSAYRREGACMLFRGDGTRIGLLSAGCLEEDLACRVPFIRESGEAETIVFDMRAEDDLSWGKGAGCNGSVHVLLERMDERLRQCLHTVSTYLSRGVAVTMVKQFTRTGGVLDTFCLTEELAQQMLPAIGASGTYVLPEQENSLYVHTIFPKPRLIIFGAGDDSIPVARLATAAGFFVLVSDWRSAFCSHERFPEATTLIVSQPEEALASMKLQEHDFVLLLTHQFQRDQQLLEQLITKQIHYIGVLGSKARTKRLLRGQELPLQVKSPVGLAIGAEGPEEIAISIVAELISLVRMKRKKGAALR